MNEILTNYGKRFLLDNIKKCTPAQQELFQRMYAGGRIESIEKTIELLPECKIDWAMKQVKKTIEKNNT